MVPTPELRLTMGYNDTGARVLLFDVETAAIPGAESYLEPVEAPANYKKEEAIASYKEAAMHRAVEKCSTDPDLARIVCLAWLLDGETAPQWVLAKNEEQERTALEMFWDAAMLPNGGVRRLGSFYGLSFDLPVLLRRSQYLGVPYPLVSIDKYRTPHLDLHARLTFNGVTKTHSLDFYVKRFALDVPSDSHTGADIARLVQEGNWDAVRHHCETDVLKLAALARRLGYIGAVEAEPAEVL